MHPHTDTNHWSDFMSASLDHSIWFFRDFDFNDWMLFSIDSPSSQNARGFSRGNIFTKDGILIASVAQEGLMRPIKKVVMKAKYDVIVVGGGAAGFFTALNIKQSKPNTEVLILERTKEVLSKVRVSGGGRCNVTHAEFIPSELINNYPRGKKELLGPFHKFMTGDTMDWFEKQGIELKIEDDGRIFPVSDSSQTIIDCF